ncbi:MAG: sensor domain-containing diguanylate cyclase [Terracidiphilus sp.]|jgi:diguanylate cyclase (GGDEF)-like protein
MLKPPIPVNESARIAILRLLNILDTQPEERFDRLTRMAKRLFDVPIAQITLVDADRQWFKSSAGAPRGESSREVSFCAHAIAGDDILIIPDAGLDERFSDNPLVLGDPNIRFYAGCPLKVGEANLGTLCVIDDKPREFDAEELQLLRDLAGMVEQELAAVQMASTDHLTTISNRRGFEALAQHALSVCKRTGRSATLLYFDLNRFKEINDTQGHAAGDEALKTFAAGLLRVFRESDVIGRIGGDEFAVLLTGNSGEAVAEVISRLEEWIRVNIREEEAGYSIGFSVGCIHFDAEKHPSVGDLMTEADSAMFEHKRAIRDGDAGA